MASPPFKSSLGAFVLSRRGRVWSRALGGLAIFTRAAMSEWRQRYRGAPNTPSDVSSSARTSDWPTRSTERVSLTDGNEHVERRVQRRIDVCGRLGRGAYGIVWKGIERCGKRRVVALKKCFNAFASSSDSQRTYREISYLLKLRGHINIIQLRHVIRAKHDLDIYLVFEYMETARARRGSQTRARRSLDRSTVRPRPRRTSTRSSARTCSRTSTTSTSSTSSSRRSSTSTRPASSTATSSPRTCRRPGVASLPPTSARRETRRPNPVVGCSTPTPT